VSRITLLTDFGTADGYVGAMKGAIAELAPDVVVDDIAHDVAPGDVAAAAWALSRYWRLYPAGTVHVVVVDPGVGSGRRAIAAEAEGRLLVAPDNGVLSLVLRVAAANVVALEAVSYFREPVSRTFHGRDVFAPVAAHLAVGVPLGRLGPAIGNPTRLVFPDPTRTRDGAEGAVIHVDRFGNLITNVPEAWCGPGALVWVGGRTAGEVRRTYADVASGELVALIGSAGLLEVSVRDGSAASALEAERGTAVRLGGEPA
jgi:S-adenosyl-L-methionine hydrolase (adenosine-forming)